MATGSRVNVIDDALQARGARECLQWFTREKAWINERHLELCRIPAPTFLEEKRAAWMAEQFRAMGYAPQVDPAGNVVVLIEEHRSKPLIALTAHLDTVLAPRSRDEISVERDGRFHGPGVADNGAGLAALLAVAQALKACRGLSDLALGLVLVANVGEEGEGNLSGMRYLARQSDLARRIRAYVVLDGPSLDHITSQALACRRFEISFSGAGGHSWTDYGNANPVHALSQAITEFTAECWPLASPSADGSIPRCTFNFGTVEGGVSINSIPALARTKLDIRSENPARIDRLVDALTGVVDRARDTENRRATGSKLTARIKEIGTRPGGRLREDSPLLAHVRAVDAHLGIRSRLDCASTDANVPLSIGIPAIAIGAGGQGGGAHTNSEWYQPDGRDMGLKRILLTLMLLLREE
ncbi:MAG TPA: M20/M25/M40 family metallo-hydrolase [Bryobacteraceae bacterium]|nr:M20/M25/M40 family metallo-hydrolase [Bryobacteraceae bacterium]